MRRRISVAAGAVAIALLAGRAQADVLRVCADPNDLPFSDRAGRGFENRIAEIVARDLHMGIAYTYAAQHETFIKKTLDAHKCDVVIGVPVGLDDVEETRPYYESGYVFVARKSSNLNLHSLDDPKLRKLKIGVHLIGGDDQPPELALGEEGVVDNVTGFMIDGDRSRSDPAASPIEAVERRDLDVAAVWGPLGGYYARKSPVPLTVTPIADTKRFAPLAFDFAIAMGVRKGDHDLKTKLDGAIARQREAILATLRNYGVPLFAIHGGIDE